MDYQKLFLQRWKELKNEIELENGASHSRYFSDELDAQDF